jgi:hypothetical protein
MKKQTEFTIPTSFKDAGYKFARSGETPTSVARWIIDQNPAFLDGASDEEKAALKEGWALRWQELNPAKRFNAEWIPDVNGGIELSLAYCLSYSQQAFGQLKNENPVQHGCIKDVRDDFNKYASNRMSDLKTAIRRVLSESKPKEKAPTKDFTTFLGDMFTSCKGRCKTAQARGDASAPSEVKLRQAIDAFYATLK